MTGKLAIIARRWLAGSLTTMLALGALSGCQPVFLSKEVYEEAYSKQNMLPDPKIEDNVPVTAPLTNGTAAPATVHQPERKPRHLTLQEAIAQALENGLPSGRSAEGRGDTTLAQYNGPGSLTNQTDRIRVLAMNPAISAAAMEASLARFDAVWVTGMNWTNTDNLQQGLSSFNNGHGANFNSSIIKAFADGSVANISFLTNYTNLNTPPAGAFSVLNPQYVTRVSAGIDMPLWRDRGVDINQLLFRLPSITGQSLSANAAGLGYNDHQGRVAGGGFTGAAAPEGILISKLRFDQSRAEFERNIHVMVKNVEIAYWNLYNKYGQLYSFEENLRILQKAYQENYYKYKAGGGQLKPYQFFQSRGQFEEFRANRTQALQEVLDAERNLRLILGMPMEDGERLIPITPPQLAELRPDWDTCLQDTLNLRPELVLARDNLKYHQYILTIQKNNLKPDLRFHARYEPVGFGNTLTGDGTFIDGTGTERTSNAFRSLRGMHFADYQLGLYLNVPIGQRLEHAAIRTARMQLAQSYYFLRDQEDKAIGYLTEQFQEVSHWYERIGAHRAERMAYAEALNSYLNLIRGGTAQYSTLDFLSIQRSYAAALVKEYNAIAEYNNSLVRLEWAKGTTLRYNNVHVSEGPLPECAQINAAQYEKERTRSIVLKQRPDALSQPGRLVATRESDVLTPEGLPPVNVIENNEGVSGKEVNDLYKKIGKSPFTPNAVEMDPAPDAKPAVLPARISESSPPLPRVILDQPAPIQFKQSSSSVPTPGSAGFAMVEEGATPAFVASPAAGRNDRIAPQPINLSAPR